MHIFAKFCDLEKCRTELPKLRFPMPQHYQKYWFYFCKKSSEKLFLEINLWFNNGTRVGREKETSGEWPVGLCAESSSKIPYHFEFFNDFGYRHASWKWNWNSYVRFSRKISLKPIHFQDFYLSVVQSRPIFYWY